MEKQHVILSVMDYNNTERLLDIAKRRLGEGDVLIITNGNGDENDWPLMEVIFREILPLNKKYGIKIAIDNEYGVGCNSSFIKDVKGKMGLAERADGWYAQMEVGVVRLMSHCGAFTPVGRLAHSIWCLFQDNQKLEGVHVITDMDLEKPEVTCDLMDMLTDLGIFPGPIYYLD